MNAALNGENIGTLVVFGVLGVGVLYSLYWIWLENHRKK